MMHTAPVTLGATPTGDPTFGLWPLFVASFDIFTIILLLGSLVAVALIVRCVMDVRPLAIRDPKQRETLLDLARRDDLKALKNAVRDDPRVVAVAVAACVERLDMGERRG